MFTLEKKLAELAQNCMRRVEERYLANDRAHRIDHAVDVVNEGIRIATVIGHEELIPGVIVAGYYHDVYRVDAAAHNFLAFKEVLSDSSYIIEIGGAETRLDVMSIATACMEHRATWTGDYSSILSKIIATADRGNPAKVDTEERIRRSYLYAIDHLGYTNASAKAHAVDHIQAKYGAGGYMKVPLMYMRLYADTLVEQSNLIDNITVASFQWEKFVEEDSNGIKCDILEHTNTTNKEYK